MLQGKNKEKSSKITSVLKEKNTGAETTLKTPEKKSDVKTFNDWFSDNKGELEEEHPELDEGDLTKMAMRKYKDYTKAAKVTHQIYSAPQSVLTSPKLKTRKKNEIFSC